MDGVLLLRVRLQNALVLFFCFFVLVFALYPGRFDGDSISQVAEGTQFQFNDVHSPVLSLALGILADVMAGPAPMFCLQLAIFFGGLFLITDFVLAEGRLWAGCAISILVTSPFVSFDYVDVQKDALITSTVVLLFGLGMQWRGRAARLTLFEIVLVCTLYIFAFSLRENVFFLIMFFPIFFVPLNLVSWRGATVAIALCLASLAVSFVAKNFVDYNLLHATKGRAIVSLVIFDLAGIAARTETDTSGGLIPQFRDNVQRCYTPHWWDPFASWGECRDVSAAASRLMANPATENLLVKRWLRMITSHPIAYLRHRIAYFSCLMRVGCRENHYMSAGLTYLRPWDAANPPRISRLGLFLEKIAFFLNDTFLASGWFWFLTLNIQLVVSLRQVFRHGQAGLPFAVAIMSASAVAYCAAFAIVGIADVSRYLHPVFALALISLPLFVSSVTYPSFSAARPVTPKTL
jgi:hypothetical protein